MKRLLVHSLFAFAIALCILTPDLLLRFFGIIKVCLVPRFFVIAFAALYFLAWLLLGCNRHFRAFILSFLFIIQGAELLSFSYFGRPINSFEINKIFSEYDDVLESGFTNWQYTLPVPLILIIFYYLAFYLISKSQKHLIKIRILGIDISWILVIAILSIQPVRFITDKDSKPWTFFPNPLHHSILNGINCLTEYFFYTNHINQSLKNYEVTYQEPLADNVVLIFGESCRYQNMSLFGYERKTTPYLDSLKNDSNFAYKKAVSIATTTSSATTMFFNINREPQRNLINNPANLFKIASRQGFFNVLISLQSASIMTSLAGSSFIDYVMTRETIERNKVLGEYRLIKELEKLVLNNKVTKKNFITLKQANAHSPYHSHYNKTCKECAVYPENGLDKTQYMTNTYDNAMILNDKIFQQIIEFCKKNLKGKTYIIFTSDHGEAIGEDGLYGHGALHPAITKVPFFIYAINADGKVIEELTQAPSPISHYEIGILIAKLLGANVYNPNLENDNLFYVHGDVFNTYHYLKAYRHDDMNQEEVEFTDQNNKTIMKLKY